MLRFRFRQRIQKSTDFKQVFDARQKAGDGVLLVFAGRNTLGTTRLGLSVSRKHGGAVVRNRLKRWLREAFRHIQAELPVGIDFVVVPLDAKRGSFENYRESLLRLTARAVRQLNRVVPPSP